MVEESHDPSRRWVLAAVGAVGSLGVAGCSSLGIGGSGGTDPSREGTTETQGAGADTPGTARSPDGDPAGTTAVTDRGSTPGERTATEGSATTGAGTAETRTARTTGTRASTSEAGRTTGSTPGGTTGETAGTTTRGRTDSTTEATTRTTAETTTRRTTSTPTRTATERPGSPSFEFEIRSTEDCGRTCVDVTAALSNTGTAPARDVSVRVTVLADGTAVWQGTEAVGRLDAGETHTSTRRVEVGLSGGARIRNNGGWVTIEALVTHDGGSVVFERRRNVT